MDLNRAGRAVSLAAGLFALWLTACLCLFVFRFPSFVPGHVDAVVVLGGSSAERLPVAQAAARDMDAPLLVVSWTETPGNASADDLCRSSVFPSPSLICFRPDGLDTRGEAQVIGKLAEANGWGTIAVVTSSYHVARAETLVRQCADVNTVMVASKPDLDSLQWLERFVIETGGLADVNLRPECGF